MDKTLDGPYQLLIERLDILTKRLADGERFMRIVARQVETLQKANDDKLHLIAACIESQREFQTRIKHLLERISRLEHRDI